jgi:hypothetical protein
MYALMELSGQEYVDQYAAKVKKASGKDRGFGAAEAREKREPQPPEHRPDRQLPERRAS